MKQAPPTMSINSRLNNIDLRRGRRLCLEQYTPHPLISPSRVPFDLLDLFC